MASNEITPTNDPPPRRPFEPGEPGPVDRSASGRASRARRVVVFLAVALAMLMALWALTEGGTRDLWRTPTTDTASVAPASAPIPW